MWSAMMDGSLSSGSVQLAQRRKQQGGEEGECGFHDFRIQCAPCVPWADPLFGAGSGAFIHARLKT